SEGTSQWYTLQQHDWLCPGDRVRVGASSRAALTLNNETLLRLAENSSIRISAPSESGGIWLDLLEGIAHFISRVRHSFQVNTPYVNASIEGTEFTVDSRNDHATITILEGRVRASNAHGEIVIADGQQALADAAQAPRVSAVVDPLDAVQWALYYPPVIEPSPEDVSANIKKSLKAYRRNDMKAACAALDQTSSIEAAPDLLAYRASLHLRVGAINAAQQDLDAALRLQPEHPGALAVMSVIATVRNERQQALDLARRAVAAAPQASPPAQSPGSGPKGDRDHAGQPPGLVPLGPDAAHVPQTE
ncbi:MAG: FecR family protein, partial [Candidatus Thiodiazotropha sp.]